MVALHSEFLLLHAYQIFLAPDYHADALDRAINDPQTKRIGQFACRAHARAFRRVIHYGAALRLFSWNVRQGQNCSGRPNTVLALKYERQHAHSARLDRAQLPLGCFFR